VGRGGHGFFARIVTPEKRRRVEELFGRHGEKIVMIARFLPGVRAVTYFTAGSARMKYRRFIFFDGMAALVSAPVFVYLGYHFGDELEALVRAVRRGESAVIIILAVVASLFIYRRWRVSAQRKREQERLARPSLPAESSTSAELGASSTARAEKRLG
jgi:membrane protein DedA with SNARE-associated domain